MKVVAITLYPMVFHVMSPSGGHLTTKEFEAAERLVLGWVRSKSKGGRQRFLAVSNLKQREQLMNDAYDELPKLFAEQAPELRFIKPDEVKSILCVTA